MTFDVVARCPGDAFAFDQQADYTHGANEPSLRPASLASEGFIHCTAGDDLMLTVANLFYKGQAGDFLVLEIDESKVSADGEVGSAGFSLSHRRGRGEGRLNGLAA